VAHKEFLRDLNGQNRLRVLIVTERGRVRRFTVQLETLIGENWAPVARYDTAHGFAHLDILHPRTRQEKIHMRAGDFNEALQLAFNDLMTNWEMYISQYLQEV
jgi:hypothetical protein